MKLPFRFTPFQLAAHLLAWVLAIWLAWDAWSGNLTVNPIQAATQRTGKDALILLALSLACTPLNTVFGLRQALTARRALGLYAFLFATTHLLIFIWIDYDFNWGFLYQDLSDKLYIFAGAGALLILTLLAVTSFQWWMKKLGQRWKKLHRLVYVAAPLVILHYAWVRKGDLFRLSGDIVQPLLFGAAVAIFLILRIPVVRQWMSKARGRVFKPGGRLQSGARNPAKKVDRLISENRR